MNSETHIINETGLRRERGGGAKLSHHICPPPDGGQGEDVTTITCNAEPSLDELLSDDTVRLLMAADGVQEGALRALLGVVKKARQDADPRRPPVATPVDRYSPRSGARTLRRERSMAVIDVSEPDGGL
jgi:hypothetical protein